MDMKLLEAELSRDEDRRAMPYLDSRGYKTVGIGHNLAVSPMPGVTFPLSDAQIDAVFTRDISTSIAKLDKYIPWWRTLSDPRQRVLANMCFNMGWGDGVKGLSGFHNTLAMIKAGQYQAAAAAMLKSRWASQVGARANRLSVMMAAG